MSTSSDEPAKRDQWNGYSHDVCFLAERPGSGDDKRQPPMTQQMPCKPVPASGLFDINAPNSLPVFLIRKWGRLGWLPISRIDFISIPDHASTFMRTGLFGFFTEISPSDSQLPNTLRIRRHQAEDVSNPINFICAVVCICLSRLSGDIDLVQKAFWSRLLHTVDVEDAEVHDSDSKS